MVSMDHDITADEWTVRFRLDDAQTIEYDYWILDDPVAVDPRPDNTGDVMAAPTFVADELVTASKMNDLPKGALGYAQVTANQGSLAGTIVDLTGLSVTVTVAAGRRSKITGHAFAFAGGTDECDFMIREGTTYMNRRRFINHSAGNSGGGSIVAVITPTAGAHTYKLGFQRTAGTGTYNMLASVNDPAFILVEDLGSV